MKKDRRFVFQFGRHLDNDTFLPGLIMGKINFYFLFGSHSDNLHIVFILSFDRILFILFPKENLRILFICGFV